MLYSRGEILEKDILIADVEESEILASSEIYIYIYIRRLNAKEVLITQRDEECVFLVADGSAKLSGRNCEFQEPTLRRETTVRRENFSGESHGDREEFQPDEKEDDAGIHKDSWAHAEARKDFYAISETSFVVTLLNREVLFFVPRKESHPIPLSNVDFTGQLIQIGDCTKKQIYDY